MDVDVIIVGGGPAGLVLASSLGEYCRVLLVERGTLGRTTKYWVTTPQRLALHNASQCVRFRSSRVLAGTYLGSSLVAQGDVVVVDELSFLKVLVGRCRDRHVLLREHCAVMSIAWSRDRVHAVTQEGVCSARLIVDASGGLSTLARGFDLHDLDGYYSVYGAHLRGLRLSTQDFVLAYVPRSGNPAPFLEIIPTGEESAFCTIFTCTRALVQPAVLATLFRSACAQNPFFTMTAGTEQGEIKAGVIPIGRLRHRRVRGVICIGEAGMVQPPLLGTAFNEILQHGQAVANHLRSLIEKTRDIPEVPGYRYPIAKRLQDRLQLCLARLLLDASVERVEQLVRVMAALPPTVIFGMYANQLSLHALLMSTVRLSAGLLLRRRSEAVGRDTMMCSTAGAADHPLD